MPIDERVAPEGVARLANPFVTLLLDIAESVELAPLGQQCISLLQKGHFVPYCPLLLEVEAVTVELVDLLQIARILLQLLHSLPPRCLFGYILLLFLG